MRALPILPGLIIPAFVALLATTVSFGQPPAEVTGVELGGSGSLTWAATPGADSYNVYRGELGAAPVGRCHGYRKTGLSFDTGAAPLPGAGQFYLVTAESDAEGEGTAGSTSAAAPRALLGSCGLFMRGHAKARRSTVTEEDRW